MLTCGQYGPYQRNTIWIVFIIIHENHVVDNITIFSQIYSMVSVLNSLTLLALLSSIYATRMYMLFISHLWNNPTLFSVRLYKLNAFITQSFVYSIVTVECHVALAKVDHRLDFEQKTPHNSPIRVSYGVSVVSIWRQLIMWWGWYHVRLNVPCWCKTRGHNGVPESGDLKQLCWWLSARLQ